VAEILAETTYDYIIAGGGMAGLSLAFLLDKSKLRDKKILIIDREIKNQNDHTWCFWENEKGNFEEIVFRKWNNVWFHGTQEFNKLLNLENYEYKMIRAVDFYECIHAKLKQNNNFEIIQSDILSVENGIVKTNLGDFEARDFVFDSSHKKTYDNPKYQNMLQHFLGFVIETENAAFKPDEATLFDFRVEQKNECRFSYVLPMSEKEALIEFTIFSDNLLERSEYEIELKKYIADVLKIEKYEIKETEFGVIPMSDEPHDQFPDSKTIRIGTSGGFVKPSTGYTFRRTQKSLQEIVGKLESSEKIKALQKPWKSFMDSVFLNVLLTKKHSADDVFTSLFMNNPTTRVLRFLDEETSLAEDYRIMRSVPIVPFSKAAIETVIKKMK
jgi:lycopene beta-cyclase